jgi:hypothetical protein
MRSRQERNNRYRGRTPVGNKIRGITSNRFGASVVSDFEGFGARAIRQTVSVASDSLFFLANFLMNLIEP